MKVDESALQHIIKHKPAHHVGLRVQIQAGGCSGFSKHMSWCEHMEPDDVLIHNLVIMDPTTADILAHATLSHVVDLSGNRLQIHIPEATTECGCGTSFNF